MVAEVSTPNPRSIRVYCPSHKVGFIVAASATIECSSQTHALARDFPNETFWEYCCDCQHYWPIDSAKGSIASEECPVCERNIVRRFLCAECKVVSVESDDAGRRKAFSISSQGTVSPACPGCLHRSVGSRFEHQCRDFASVFVTTREVCPFCDERLEPPPNFPCSVATYLERLPRSALAVTFETETGLIKESTVGEYLLVQLRIDSSLSIVIPKSTTLGSKQDYYNVYYELFNCENPAAGEVVILSPAVVEAVEGGWQLKEAGFIEIKAEPLPDVQTTITCKACGNPVDAKHAFCKRCGAKVESSSNDHQTISGVAGPQSEPSAEQPEFSAPSAFTSHVDQTTSSYESSTWKPANVGPSTKTVVGVVGGVVVLGLVLTIIAAISSSSSNSVEKKLDGAILRGQIFPPAADNAHDLYYELKNSGASEETLRTYRERLLPLLINRPYQIIKEFMVPGSDDPPLADWQSAYQSLQWAVELKPGDSVLKSRMAYCEGRLAFLSKDEDQAIAAWTRSAEADKAWPLPINGIGLIYSARRNYSTARSYYFDAVRRDQNWAYPYNNLGTSYYMEKNYSDAKSYYQKAVQLAPQWARPHSWLGDIAMKEGDYSTAIQEFSLVLDQNATGTKNMDLDKIRKQLDLARQRAVFED